MSAAMVMAAVARQGARRETRRTRATVLAQQKHLVGAPRHIGVNSSGGQLYRVRSQTRDAYYIVTVYSAISDAACCCTAGAYHRPCAHVGAALLAGRQREACESTDWRDAHWRSWLNGGEW